MEVIKPDFVILKDTKLSTDWDSMVLFDEDFVSGSNWDGKPVTETTLSNNVWTVLWGGGSTFYHQWVIPGDPPKWGAGCLYCTPEGLTNLGSDWIQGILQTEDYGNWEINFSKALNGTQFAVSLDQNIFNWMSTPGLTGHLKVTYFHSERPRWDIRELDDELQPIEET